MSAQLPVLPLYIEQAGASKYQVGLIMGGFALGLVLSRSWLGYLADYRSRKLVLGIGLMAAAIAPLGYHFFPVLPLLVLFRAVHGLGLAAFTSAFVALVVDFSPIQRRSELIALMTMVNPIAVSLGPVLGGVVQAQAGYMLLFGITASLSLLGLLLLGPVQDAEGVRADPHQKTEKDQLWVLLLGDRVRVPALVMLMAGIAFGTLSTYIPLFMKAQGVLLNPGWFYGVAAIASISTRLVIGRILDRFGRGLFISFSLLTYTLSLLSLSLANSGPMFVLAGLLEGSGFGLLVPMFSSLMADRAHPQERARLYSLCMTGFDLGLGAGGSVLGLIAENAGYSKMFVASSLLVLTALLIFMTQSNHTLAQSLQFSLGRRSDGYAVKSV
jgi:MFS family permease